MWRAKPNFLGANAVPAGVHFLYWDTSDTEDDTDSGGVPGLRCGVFFHSKASQVSVYRWCKASEVLQRVRGDDETRVIDAYRDGRLMFNLGHYPDKWSQAWKEITFCISEELINRIEPVGQQPVRASVAPLSAELRKALRTNEVDEVTAAAITAVKRRTKSTATDGQISDTTGNFNNIVKTNDSNNCTATMDSSSSGGCLLSATSPPTVDSGDGTADANSSTLAEPLLASQNIPLEMFEKSSLDIAAYGLDFVDIPKPTPRAGESATEITSKNMDRSAILDRLIASDFKGNESWVIGELQTAYISFLFGQQWQGFEQWKKLLLLLCSCDAALTRRSGLSANLIRSLYSHLQQAPDDFFSNELLQSNFITNCLLGLSEICTGSGAAKIVKQRFKLLEALFKSKFGQTLDDLRESIEEAAVVVDESAQLLSFDT
eukprot:Lankesteria_metandrocarpae@DN3246_c0_g1_i1.p1